jgi:hypothetical protein
MPAEARSVMTWETRPMKSILLAAILAASALTTPILATPALAATGTPSPVPAPAAFSVQSTPIALIIKNAAAKAVLDKEVPGLRFFYGRVSGMTVAQLAEHSHGRLDDAKVKAIQAGFDKIR